MLHETLQTNHMIYSVMHGPINLDLIEHTKDEKMMNEFVQWLKDLPLALLDKRQSIPYRIHDMISILCFAKEKKVLDIAKIILKIYLNNNMTDFITNVILKIIDNNNIETLYEIISCYPTLKDISKELWLRKCHLYNQEKVYAEITNFLPNPKTIKLDDVSKLIEFLKILNKPRVNLEPLIALYSEVERNLKESKEVEIDMEQIEIISFAEQQNIINDRKKVTDEINIDDFDFIEEEYYSEDEVYDEEVSSGGKNYDEEEAFAKAIKESEIKPK